MAGSRKGKVFAVLLLLLIATCGTIVSIVYQGNKQWYVVGRTALVVKELVDPEGGIQEGQTEFSLSVTFGEEELEGTGTLFFQKPDKFRLQLDSNIGRYTIVNNETTWIHYRDRNAVLVCDPDLPKTVSEAFRFVPRFILASGAGQANSGSVIDLTNFVHEQVPELKEYDISLTGVETVDTVGSCYALSARPLAEDSDIESLRVWINPRNWFPAKIEVHGPVVGTVVLRQVSFEDVADEQFALTIPEGAQVQTIPREMLLDLAKLMPLGDEESL